MRASDSMTSKTKEETKAPRRQGARKKPRQDLPPVSSCDESQSSGLVQSRWSSSSQDASGPHGISSHGLQVVDPRLAPPTASMELGGLGVENQAPIKLPLPSPTEIDVSELPNEIDDFDDSLFLPDDSLQPSTNVNHGVFNSSTSYSDNGVNFGPMGELLDYPLEGFDETGTQQGEDIHNTELDERNASALLAYEETSNSNEDETSTPPIPSYQPTKKRKKAVREDEITMIRSDREKENREIKQLRAEELKSWGEISDILNENRLSRGITERLSQAAVYGRFARNSKELARQDGDLEFDPQDYMHVRVKRTENREERLKRFVDVRGGTAREKPVTRRPEQSEQQQAVEALSTAAALNGYTPIAPRPAGQSGVSFLNAQEVEALHQAYGEAHRQFWQNAAQNFAALTGRRIEAGDCLKLWQMYKANGQGKSGTT